VSAGLRYAALGTGTGRPTGKNAKVRDVESLPCPDRDGPHWLRNSAQRGGLVTACIGCGLSWAELDAQARSGNLPPAPPEPCKTCGRRLVRAREWKAADDAQRRAWEAAGIGPQNAPGQCHGCYQKVRRAQTRLNRKVS
jgi:hypothetical protein